MRRFGVSTNCLMAEPLADVLMRLSEICDLVEIQCDARHSLFLYEDVCREFDLRYTIHAPTGDGNIASSFEPMRRASIAVIRETAEAGDRIGAETLVIHPGFCLYPDERDASTAAMLRRSGRCRRSFPSGLRWRISGAGTAAGFRHRIFLHASGSMVCRLCWMWGMQI